MVFILLILTILTPIAASRTASAASSNEGMSVYFFYGDGCPHCALVEPLIDSLAAKYPQVNFIKLEVWYNSANKALFQDFNARYEINGTVVPSVFIADQALIREGPIQGSLESNIQRIISTNNTINPLRYSAAEAREVIKNAHPVVKFTTEEGAVFNSSQVVLSWNYTSWGSYAVTVKGAIDGGSFITLALDAKSYITSGLSNGNHTFTLRITDKSGLSANHSLNFTVDLGSQSNLGSIPSNSLPIGLGIFVLIMGFSVVIIQRTRKKA